MKKFYISFALTLCSIALFGQCLLQTQHSNCTCCNVCNGTAQAFFGGTSPYTYLWMPGSKTTQSVTGLCAGTYTVTCTDANACSRTAAVTITQPTCVNAIASAQASSSCSNCNGILTGTASGGNAPYTYLWSNGCNQQTCTGVCAGTYTFTVTDINGCTATTTVNVGGPTPPTVTVTTTSSTATAIPSGSSPFTYIWSTSPPQTTQTATGLAPGTYTVCVTDVNNCTTCKTCQIVASGIANYSASINLNVYPNPAGENIFVEAALEKAQTVNISITNVLGELLYSENVAAPTALSRKIFVGDITKGIYFVRLTTSAGSSTKKITIQ